MVDVFSRYIVGWRALKSLQTDIVLDALEQVRRFDIDDTGALFLIGGPENSAMLTAHRP